MNRPLSDRLEVAWQATNAAGLTVQLFHFPWTSPQPNAVIESIVFSTTPSERGPFLIAISVEE